MSNIIEIIQAASATYILLIVLAVLAVSIKFLVDGKAANYELSKPAAAAAFVAAAICAVSTIGALL